MPPATPPQSRRRFHEPVTGDRRVGKAILGLWLIAAGLAILAALLLLHFMKPRDAWHAIGIGVGATLYSMLGPMFILLGLQRLLGDNSWLPRQMERAKKQMAMYLAGTGILIVVVVLVIVW